MVGAFLFCRFGHQFVFHPQALQLDDAEVPVSRAPHLILLQLHSCCIQRMTGLRQRRISRVPPQAKPNTMSSPPTPENILKMGTAFWASKALLSAVELGLFTELT